VTGALLLSMIYPHKGGLRLVVELKFI